MSFQVEKVGGGEKRVLGKNDDYSQKVILSWATDVDETERNLFSRSVSVFRMMLRLQINAGQDSKAQCEQLNSSQTS